MPVLINPDSELGKELRRWDTPSNKEILDSSGNTVPGVYGFGPVGHQVYPKMVFKALEHNGKWVCMQGSPNPMHYSESRLYDLASQVVDAFNKSCQFIVKDDLEHKRATNDGWRDHPTDAVDFALGLQRDIANAAAEANFAAKSMTPKAQAERAKRDAATDKHVPE